MPELEYEIRGDDALLLRIRAIGPEQRQEIIEILSEAAAIAESEWKGNIPYHSGVLYRSIRQHEVRFAPGAAGGGGFYELELSVGGEPEAEHLQFVVEGTGIFGPRGNRIFPANGNVMVFNKNGEDTVYTRYTEGQRAQDSWIEAGQQAAREFVAISLYKLDQKLQRA